MDVMTRKKHIQNVKLSLTDLNFKLKRENDRELSVL